MGKVVREDTAFCTILIPSTSLDFWQMIFNVENSFQENDYKLLLFFVVVLLVGDVDMFKSVSKPLQKRITENNNSVIDL